MELHLVPTQKPSSLLIGDNIFDDATYEKLCYSNSFGFTLFDEENNHEHTNKKLLIITDDSEINEGDVYFIFSTNDISTATSNNRSIRDLLDGICRKIVASNSRILTPRHFISDKDIEYVVKYYNEYKVLPTGKLETEVVIDFDSRPENDGEIFGNNRKFELKSDNGYAVINWDNKPKDLIEWLETEGLPTTKSILEELKSINQENDRAKISKLFIENDKLSDEWKSIIKTALESKSSISGDRQRQLNDVYEKWLKNCEELHKFWNI